MSVHEKMVVLHEALAGADIEHAFGGALALAWCTQQARGTIDIDINLFLPPTAQDRVLAALPLPIESTEAHRAAIERDGQVRLFWEDNPVDLFFNTTPFHEAVGERVRWEPFAGRDLPFLSCQDLAVFKVFFNRTKDWGDLEAMHDAGTLDVEHVLGVVVHYLGADDERIERLRTVASRPCELRVDELGRPVDSPQFPRIRSTDGQSRHEAQGAEPPAEGGDPAG